MCGIAGYIGLNPPGDERAAACLVLMTRRGPDAQAVYRHTAENGRTCYLLHSRLSIIDLDSTANQPMVRDGYAIALNGEIYNFLELRQVAEREGANFRTKSDTEVLLNLLSRDGISAFAQCEGMWAVAHYEEVSGNLILSRDRFGEKPLYLHRDSTGLYFGSEPKFIFALLGRRLPVNRNHLCRYLVNGYKALYKTKETFFIGIDELAPATTLLVSEYDVQESRFWNPSFEQDQTLTFADSVALAKEALIASMRIRLRADVPIAFCMSGGVDSNALISMAKRCFGYEVHGFTIMNTDARYEEKEMVDCAVQELGIQNTSLRLDTGDFLSKLRVLVRQHDAPVYTISYYIHWLLMEAVHSEGYRISVSGTAADELFSGYYDHHNLFLAMLKDQPEQFSDAFSAWERYVKPIVRNPYLQNPYTFIDQPNFRSHIFLDADRFSAALCDPWQEEFTEITYTQDLLRNRMANELFHESVPVILHEDDLNAMYFSIENRSPFLDSNLFSVCNRIPTRHLIRDGCAKAVLREAMRGIVPDTIIDNRRKVGFNAPLSDLMDVQDPQTKASLLSDSPIYDVVSRDAIAKLLDQSYFPNSQSKFLFNFICAKLFLEEYCSYHVN